MKSEILIIEDDFVIAESIATDLREADYEIFGQCDNGGSALELIKDGLPDLILMDIKLKGNMSGIELADQIQKSYNIPIIYLTDYSDSNTFEKARHTIPANYLTKPFQTHQLLIAIELALANGIYTIDKEFGFFKNSSKEALKVYYKDILYLKSDKVYCHVILKDSKFVVSQPMKTIYKRIPYKDLIRVSKTYCINKNHIDKIIGNSLYIGSERITIGDRYRQHAKKHFNII